MRENLTELVFILDRSGSMSGLESDTIGGFNSMIKKQQKEDGEAFVSTVLFDDKCDVLHDRVEIKKVKKMTDKDYCTENNLDLYGSKKVNLPRPELYVIFSGERKDHPEYISLNDEFWGGNALIDAKVKVIYDGKPGDIINQYVTFTKVAKDQIKKYGRTQKAAEETIHICISEDVLADYLKEKEVEVMDIMTALFDEEEVTRRYGLRMQKEALERTATNMLAKGKMSVDEIAECTGLSVEEVEKLANIELV